MRLVFALALLGPAALAQVPADSVVAGAPPSGPSATLVLAGATAGALSVAVGSAVLGGAGVPEGQRGWAYLLYPVGVAAGVHVVGRESGLDGSLGPVVRGTARGVLVAAVGIAFAGAGVGLALENDGGGAAGALVLGGLVLAVLAPPYLAARGYRAPAVEPVVLRGPDGERAAGVAFRVGL